MNRFRTTGLLVLLVGVMASVVGAQDHFLSALNADKNDPLFTTYAAAMQRSEFVLDEGFEFVFYDSSRGADFTTDTAGDWCMAFKMGPEYVYTIDDMVAEPVITTSYPDLCQYHFEPLKDIKVTVFFLSYGSTLALRDVDIENTGREEKSFRFFSFLHNTYRTFDNIERRPSQNSIFFEHEEFPDSWVLAHDVPYVSRVYNGWCFSDSMDRLTSFRSYKWGNIVLPQVIDMEKKRRYTVWGRITDGNDERCRYNAPDARFMVLLNNDRSRLLTHTAPRWGSTELNIPGNGYYGIELGNFGKLKTGDRYSLIFFCETLQQSGTINATIKNPDSMHQVRKNIQLNKSNLPASPSGFKKDVWGSGTEIRLFWKRNPGAVYNVYRRNYRTGGVYERIANKISKTFFTDKNLSRDKIYGYVVTAIYPDGRMSMPTDEVTNIALSEFLTDVKYPDQIKTFVPDFAKVIAAEKSLHLKPGQSYHFREVRHFARNKTERRENMKKVPALQTMSLKPFVAENNALFANIPQLNTDDQELQLLYYSAFSLMRQVMLPPENKCSYNWYVFSREPTWGWGHGGQVFHESLTMLAYAFMDPLSAMNSQRVYHERQYDSGYINYRTGAYLDEIIEHNGQLTSSAPWYAWQNWMVYKISGDEQFLKEMYTSSKAFFDYYTSNRDSDGDGLYEWGAHAVLECVRDALVAVWDQVDWPSNFEGLDVNSMLVMEAKSLAAMARELQRPQEAKIYQEFADQLSNKINRVFWDEETSFFYHVDKNDHDFTWKEKNDLKRREIIGFLPLWAGIVSPQRAERLVQTLTDSSRFWRRFGVPSLSADDPYYNPKGYWNGPVWVEWDYLIHYGLLQYGYDELARELTNRVSRNMTEQLKKDHNLWEFYSPDHQWAGYHKTYIWAGMINRMLLDIYNPELTDP
jgi:hypothetical protein